MALKYFYDGMSQPSRSVLLLLRCASINFEPCVTHIARGLYFISFSVKACKYIYCNKSNLYCFFYNINNKAMLFGQKLKVVFTLYFKTFKNSFVNIIGEHMTEDYGKVNPTKKVPALLDGDFPLFERYNTYVKSKDEPSIICF